MFRCLGVILHLDLDGWRPERVEGCSSSCPDPAAGVRLKGVILQTCTGFTSSTPGSIPLQDLVQQDYIQRIIHKHKALQNLALKLLFSAENPLSYTRSYFNMSKGV